MMGLTTPLLPPSDTTKAALVPSTGQKDNSIPLTSHLHNIHTHIPLDRLNLLFNDELKTIQFTHSDAQNYYAPPAVSKNNDTHEYLYFDVTHDQEDTKVWRSKIGCLLANRVGYTDQSANWTITSFPVNYCLVKAEAKTKRNRNVRWRLYGGSGRNVYESPNEFLPHAIWLSTKNSEGKPCQCKPCHGSERQSGIIRNTQKKLTQDAQSVEAQKSTRTISTSNYKSQSKSSLIRKEPAPKTETLPGIPIASASVCRTNDLAKLTQTTILRMHEGFREQEVVMLQLTTPITYRYRKQSERIEEWPVLIKEVHFQVQQNDHQDSDGSEKVVHKAQYTIGFFGSDEEIRVDSDRLSPAITSSFWSQFPAQEITTMTHILDYLENVKIKTLNLENGEPRANIQDVMCTFFGQMLLLAQKKMELEATGKFNNQSDWHKADKTKMQNINLTAYVEQEKICKKSVSFVEKASTEKDQVQSVRSLASNAADVGHYATLEDDDDSSARRRCETQKKMIVAPVKSTLNETVDTNRYWTGIFVGFERIWVGDVVRLNLEESEVRHIINLLVCNNNLSNRMDRSEPNLQSPIVMRIKAIFQNEKDDNLSIAGDLYRVVNTADAKRAYQEFTERRATNRNQPDIDNDICFSSGSSSRGQYQYRSSSSLLLVSQRPAGQAPAYFPPCHSQLSASRTNQLPPSPMLPEGFGYQQFNQSNVEIVVGTPHIAGRMYCSMVTSHNEPNSNLTKRVRELQRLPYNKNVPAMHGSDHIRMCLAGLLPASQLSMGVKALRPFKGARVEAFQNAGSIAAAKLKEHILNSKERNDKDVKETKLSSQNVKHFSIGNHTSQPSVQPKIEKSKRKLDDVNSDERDFESVKKSKGEIKEEKFSQQFERKLNVTKTDDSLASISQAKIKDEHFSNQPKNEQDQLKTETVISDKVQANFRSSTPPGYIRKLDYVRRRKYYVNPKTGDAVWGRKFVVESETTQ